MKSISEIKTTLGMKNSSLVMMLCGLWVFLSLSIDLQAQQKSSTQEVVDYFQDRISKAPFEDRLVSFLVSKKIKISELEGVEEQVWNLWKTTVKETYQLPEPSVVTQENPPETHHWDLIEEEPMPFYYLKKEKEGATSKEYPLFLNLHGSGPKQMEFKATLSWSLKYADTPSIYFIPQIPSMKRYRWWYVPEQQAWEKLLRIAMVDENIDPNRIYVLGISEGGYGSQRLGAFYADYWAGAGPMAGGEPLKNAPPLNFRNIAFSLQTGENDKGFGRNELTAKAKDAFDSLAAANPGDFEHQVVLQPEKGHWIDYTKTTPWLSQFTRNPNPSHISWLLFPMHHRYRKGFYNVAVIEPLAIKEGDDFDRALFDIQFDKERNIITVKANAMDNDMNELKPVKEGKIAIYLNDQYVNLKKKVKVIYNGKVIQNKKVKLNKANIIESVAFYGDPYRIFPAKIEIEL